MHAVAPSLALPRDAGEGTENLFTFLTRATRVGTRNLFSSLPCKAGEGGNPRCDSLLRLRGRAREGALRKRIVRDYA